MESSTTEDLQLRGEIHGLSCSLTEFLVGIRFPKTYLMTLWSRQLTAWRSDCTTNNREAALIEVQQALQGVITPLLERECPAANDHNRDFNHGACDHLMKIGYYFAQLSKSSL